MRNKLAILFVVLLCAMACTNNKRDVLYPAVKCAADTMAAVSFAKDIQPIFKANCALAGCHSGGSPAGNLDLDSTVAYLQLWRHGSGYIDTADAASSLLYSQMVSTATPMPPTGRLDGCAIALVLKWVQQKGSNN